MRAYTLAFSLCALALGSSLLACGDVDGPGSGSDRDRGGDKEGNGGGGETSGGGSATGGGASTAGGSTGAPTSDPADGGADGSAGIPTGPTTAEVPAANGRVSFDLGPAVPALAGGKLTALITVNAGSGSAPGILSLTDMRLSAPASSGLQAFRPVIVVVGTSTDPATGKPKETVGTIGTNFSMELPAGRTAPIVVNAASAEGYVPGAKVKVRFSALRGATPTAIVGLAAYKECKSPDLFFAWANPNKHCGTCHGAKLERTMLDEPSADRATACGLNLRIFDAALRGGGAAPTMTAPGNHTNERAPSANYTNALNAWRAAEGY